jgi:6-phosphofructokinase 1
METIAVLTSGGDAPGMNAAIRASVRAALASGLQVYGAKNGFSGLVSGDFQRLHARSVTNILQRGGTMLGTSRSIEFESKEGRKKAAENLKSHSVEGLILIGGQGTAEAALIFHKEYEIPTVVIPASIDNDIPGTDFSVGFDTAVNGAMEAIDRIRDTAESSGRIFFVEVMGRSRGYIALYAGLSGGADAIFIPEEKEDLEALCKLVIAGHKAGKSSFVVVVAEGEEAGGAFSVAERGTKQLGERVEFDYRVTVLGHLQRGGTPSSNDRVLGTILGAAAVEGLGTGVLPNLVGEINNNIVFTPLNELGSMERELPKDLLHLLHTVGTT